MDKPAQIQPDETECVRVRVVAAPGMLDREHTVVREDGETDAEYEARCRLFAAMLDHAKR